MVKEPYSLAFTFHLLNPCICQIHGDQSAGCAEAPGDQLGSPGSREQFWPGALPVVEREDVRREQ